MAADEVVTIVPAPSVSDKLDVENTQIGTEKVCNTCQTPISRHEGKTASGKCLGVALNRGLSDLMEVVRLLRNELDEERREARDREARLLRSIKDLQREVHAQAELLTRTDERLAGLEKSSTVARSGAEQRDGEGRRPRRRRTNGKSATNAEQGEGKKARTDTVVLTKPAQTTWYQTSDEESSSENFGSRDHPGKSKSRPEVRTTKIPAASTLPVAPEIHVPDLAFDSGDSSWELICSKKPRTVKRAVLYVGNLDENTTIEKLEKFMSSRAKAVGADGVELFHSTVNPEKNGQSSRVFRKSGEMSSARITVNASAMDMLLRRSFWPAPVYARKWNFDLSPAPATSDSGDKRPDN